MNLTSFTWSSASSRGLKVSPGTLAHIGRIWARPPGGGSETTWTREAWSALGGVIEIAIAAGSGWDRDPRRGRVCRWSVQEDPNLAPRLNYGHSLPELNKRLFQGAETRWGFSCSIKTWQNNSCVGGPKVRKQRSPTFLNLRASSWLLSHMKSYQFATLYWNQKLSHLLIIINDSALCEDTDHINEFSIIIITHSELLLYEIGYYTQLNELCYI